MGDSKRPDTHPDWRRVWYQPEDPEYVVIGDMAYCSLCGFEFGRIGGSFWNGKRVDHWLGEHIIDWSTGEVGKEWDDGTVLRYFVCYQDRDQQNYEGDTWNAMSFESKAERDAMVADMASATGVWSEEAVRHFTFEKRLIGYGREDGRAQDGEESGDSQASSGGGDL